MLIFSLLLEVERQSIFGSPPRDRDLMANESYRDQGERMREERLTRILRMERELALLRSREEDVPHPSMDSRERERDRYRRPPGPLPSLSSSGYQSSYLRERDNGASFYHGSSSGGRPGGIGDRDRDRSYYSHGSPPREYTTRGLLGSYRDTVSYPSQYTSGGYNRSSTTVGYSGGSGSANESRGSSSSVPPGWMSDDKPVASRPPFSTWS